ncbi:serine/threonine-protein kinase [Kitasatospora sp. NPDC004745]|uniref:serine/threonine-protein kinase n=1 Tax=Kitasatospora sp. NPDC004745 TaxID=3364019 RepID=UPI0036CEEE51
MTRPPAGDGDTRLLAGRYRLIEQLGRGGMGTVWRAHDELLDREVAVKEVSVSGPTAEEQEVLHARLRQEARAAARIRHPAVVTVFDVLQEDGRPWIVMELVDGRSLADVLAAEGALSPRDTARIGAVVVDALDQAHQLGILHRDVKPANVLLERGGRIVLTDFGIALLADSPGLTRTGDLVGSPDYLAPECAVGRRPGPPADLWSLGATLYTAVEGRSPFGRASTLGTLQAVISDPLPEPRHAGSLAPVLEALLRKDPQERPTAAGARRMLDEVAAGAPGPPPEHPPTRAVAAGGATATHPTPAAPTPSADRPGGSGASRRRRRTRLLAALGAVLLAVVVAGLAWALAAGGGTPASRTASPTATSAASAQPGSGQPTSAQPGSAPGAPVITGWSTYQEGQLVYLSVRYSAPDATGFGFRGVNGSTLGEEDHDFAHPSYGRVSPGRVDYPYNLLCGTPQHAQTDLDFWIFTAQGQRSMITVHLTC